MIGRYAESVDAGGNLTGLTKVKEEVYFGGRRLGAMVDRLGSVVTAGKKYLPYGDEVPTTAGDGYRFATYYRDGESGLDYADQRYYASVSGRFLTPDPYMASGGVASPGSWNRYAYVEGDPVNLNDPEGLIAQNPWGLTYLKWMQLILMWQRTGRRSPVIVGTDPTDADIDAAFRRINGELLKAKDALKQKQLTPNCQELLDALGVTEKEWFDKLASVKFANGLTGLGGKTLAADVYKAAGGDVYKEAKRVYGSQTLRSWFNESGAELVSAPLGATVWVNALAYSGSSATAVRVDLMHETLHLLGFSHSVLTKQWGLSGSGDTEIERAIRDNCFR